MDGNQLAFTLDLSTLESHLWEAANILRGSPVDRTDWKSYVRYWRRWARRNPGIRVLPTPNVGDSVAVGSGTQPVGRRRRQAAGRCAEWRDLRQRSWEAED